MFNVITKWNVSQPQCSSHDEDGDLNLKTNQQQSKVNTIVAADF